MKTTTFTLSAMALGLMAGITITHHHQVSEIVARGGADAYPVVAAANNAIPVAQLSNQASPADGPATAEELTKSHVSVQQPVRYALRSDREDALLELLAEMRKEQKEMHKQMAEQNREVAELTFRVDTHSDSFKPLRTDSTRPRPIDSAITPAIPSMGDDDSLLPPKPASSQ